MKSKYVIFDLDDTLMYEINYLKSAYLEIAQKIDSDNFQAINVEMLSLYENKENVFEILMQKYSTHTLDNLISTYRNHFPRIALNEGAAEILDFFKNKRYKLGLITDGRSITQRNKLKSLSIENKFDKIIVSEELGSSKPDLRNFNNFIEDGISEYYYIADNPSKDFITPNKLGWTSICLLNNGKNIHPQNFDIDYNYLPKIRIKKLIELIDIIS